FHLPLLRQSATPTTIPPPPLHDALPISLKNGMTLGVLFEQLKTLRERVSIPVFLMGYFNPVLQYGVENFCRDCHEAGIQGAIIPDLPMYEYEELYQEIFRKYQISNVFLVTPQTSEERIHKIEIGRA